MKPLFASIVMSAAVLGFSGQSAAATTEAKAAYEKVKDTAAADYKVARAKCDPLTGNAKDVCVAEAKAARTHTVADAEAQYKNTPRAQASARKDIADADYAVAKAKCDGAAGNEKDVCIKQAKAAKVAAVADAKADKKTVEARTDAKDDKRDANYKVEMEKCDALAGPSKDACVASVKSKFNKS
jgi:hypothetical protein